MKARTQSKGELYESFRTTLYYEDLSEFIARSIQECKDNVVKYTVSGETEKAKEFAYKLAGFKSITDYMDECVKSGQDAKEEEQQDKDYAEQVFKHV